MLAFYFTLIEDEENKTKFEELYNRYNNRLFYVANSVLTDYYEAEDALQNAYIKIAKNIEKVGTVNDQKTLCYLVTIVRNTAIDILRKRNAASLSPIDDKLEFLDDGKNLEDYICDQSQTNIVKEAIRKIESPYSEVLMLHFVYDLSPKEIAKRLDKNSNLIRQQIFRGKARLLQLIKEVGILEKSEEQTARK